MPEASHMSRFVPWLMVPVMVSVLCACRRHDAKAAKPPEPAVVIDMGLRHNRTAGLQSAIYQSQADSPIHWQPWSVETMEMAEKSGRLLFVVIALPQYTSFVDVLRHMSETPAVVASLNNEYVPVLVDADAAREVGVLVPMLCAEIKSSVQLPIFLWMTHEGNPVAWTPVGSRERKDVIALFDRSQGMTGSLWRDERAYVLTNSAMDNRNRRLRMEEMRRSVVHSEKPEADLLLALRKMLSLYDPYSRNFDEAGALFPYGMLEFLSVAARQPGIPADLREKSGAVVREMLNDLLPSPMFDPLDGGVFSSRRGPSWALPSFQRDCVGQARAVTSLVEAWHATGDAFALERAQGVLRFAETSYKLEDGLFVYGLDTSASPELWMWTLEELKELLPADQAEWWIRESGIKGLGNLPSESDPRREFFRANALFLTKSFADYKAAHSEGAEAFSATFESSRRALIDKRKTRISRTFADRSPHPGACFRMVSAYAAMFTATADEACREKAVDLLQTARDAFSDGRFVHAMRGADGGGRVLGRAFHYALALQAALDVAAITGDKKWMVWAEDLSTSTAEQFTGNGILRECPEPARVLDLPVADTIMVFDDSSAGLFSSCASRMAALKRPMLESFRDLATPLPAYVVDRPVLHTDLLLATLLRHYPVLVCEGDTMPEELASAVRRLSIRGVQRAVEGSGKEGAAMVVWPQAQERTVDSADALRALMAEIRR